MKLASIHRLLFIRTGSFLIPRVQRPAPPTPEEIEFIPAVSQLHNSALSFGEQLFLRYLCASLAPWERRQRQQTTPNHCRHGQEMINVKCYENMCTACRSMYIYHVMCRVWINGISKTLHGSEVCFTNWLFKNRLSLQNFLYNTPRITALLLNHQTRTHISRPCFLKVSWVTIFQTGKNMC